jgi:hypothetical protein
MCVCLSNGWPVDLVGANIPKHLELAILLFKMTIPVLKPDILRRVVEFALESCIVSGDDAATQLEKQRYLANLILVSKVRDPVLGVIWLTTRSSRRYVLPSCIEIVSLVMPTSYYMVPDVVSILKNRNYYPKSKHSESIIQTPVKELRMQTWYRESVDGRI